MSFLFGVLSCKFIRHMQGMFPEKSRTSRVQVGFRLPPNPKKKTKPDTTSTKVLEGVLRFHERIGGVSPGKLEIHDLRGTLGVPKTVIESVSSKPVLELHNSATREKIRL